MRPCTDALGSFRPSTLRPPAPGPAIKDEPTNLHTGPWRTSRDQHEWRSPHQYDVLVTGSTAGIAVPDVPSGPSATPGCFPGLARPTLLTRLRCVSHPSELQVKRRLSCR